MNISKYVQFKSTTLSYPGLTHIYLLLSLFTCDHGFTIQNFIKGSAKPFRVWKGFVAKLILETTYLSFHFG